MRLFLLLLVWCGGLMPAFAQKLLKGKFENTPLPEVFQKLERQANLSISFDPAQVNNKRISASFSGVTVQEAFDIALRGTSLQAEIIKERYVIIRPQANAAAPTKPKPVCGRVLDSNTGDPLGFASVFAVKSKQHTLTDSAGYFKLAISDTYILIDTLSIRYFGYKSPRVPLKKFATQQCPKILLYPDDHVLVEIVVRDRATEAIEAPSSETSIGLRPDRTGFVPAFGEPDPFRMLQFLPGVRADNDKSGDLLVRGGGNDQNLIMWEGIPIYHNSHVFGLVSALNPYVVNRVQFWKGNAGAQYGGRASSIVDMRSELTPPRKFRAALGVNQLSAYLSLEAPLFRHKGGILFATRGAMLFDHPVFAALFKHVTGTEGLAGVREASILGALGLPNEQHDGASFKDANFKCYWAPNVRNRVEWSVYSGEDRRQLRDSVPSAAYWSGDTATSINFGSSIRWKRQWSGRFSSEWLYARSHYATGYGFGWGNATNAPISFEHRKNVIEETLLHFDQTSVLSPHLSLRFGAQFDGVANSVGVMTKVDTGFVSIFNNYSANHVAFYGQVQWRPDSMWEIEAGIRAVRYKGAGLPFIEPRVNISRKLASGISVRANIGIFTQFVRRSFEGVPLSMNDEAWIMSAVQRNALRPFQGRQMALGGILDKAGWVVSGDFYIKKLASLTGISHHLNGLAQPIPNSRGTEQSAGLELMARKKWGPITHWVSYTLSKTTARYDSIDGGIRFPADSDQRHVFRWTPSFSSRHWDISASWNLLSGRPYTPAVAVTSAGVLDYGLHNSARLGIYKRVDCSVQYSWSKKWFKMSSGLTIYNLFNRKNAQDRQYFAAPGATMLVLDRYALGGLGNIFLLFKF